jgi:hypothetical protein
LGKLDYAEILWKNLLEGDCLEDNDGSKININLTVTACENVNWIVLAPVRGQLWGGDFHAALNFCFYYQCVHDA